MLLPHRLCGRCRSLPWSARPLIQYRRLWSRTSSSGQIYHPETSNQKSNYHPKANPGVPPANTSWRRARRPSAIVRQERHGHRHFSAPFSISHTAFSPNSAIPTIEEQRHMEISELMRLPFLSPYVATELDQDGSGSSDVIGIAASRRPKRIIPRDPIVLCHGLYGYDVRGPFLGLEIHYWAKVIDILRKRMGVEVIMKGVPGTGSIQERAEALHEFLCSPAAGVRGKKLHFIGHSMGGLDARYLISQIRPTPDQYTPLTLTTISTPHRGSPFMDWCNANVGIGQEYIELEIENARKEGKIPWPKSESSHVDVHDSSTSDEVPKANSAEVKSVFVKSPSSERKTTKESAPRPPFSLNTPIFVRRKEAKKENSQPKADEREDSAKGVIPSIAGVGAAASGAIVDTAGASLKAVGMLQSTAVAAESADDGPMSDRKPGMRERLHEAMESNKDSDSKTTKSDAKSRPVDLGVFTRLLSEVSGSFSNYMLSVLDQPAYAMLSTRYMKEVFNPTVPNDPRVQYFSVAARVRKLPVWHPLWLPKLVLDAAAESKTSGGEVDGSADALGGDLQGNDGIVSVRSAKWGHFLGIVENSDHWDLRGGGAPRLASKINPITGRPYPTKQEEPVGEDADAQKQGESKSSWMDINRLLRALTRSKAKEEKAEDDGQTVQPNSSAQQTFQSSNASSVASFLDYYAEQLSPASPAEDGFKLLSREDGDDEKHGKAWDHNRLLKEVVGWISERLPEGDETRRRQAERKADEQEQEAKAHQIDDDDPAHPFSLIANAARSEIELLSTSKNSEEPRLGKPKSPTETSKSPAVVGVRATLAGLLPDEVSPQQLSPFKAAPMMSQDRRSDAGGIKAVAGKKEEKPQKKEEKKLSKQDEELERFWRAVCYHLCIHGY